MRLVLLLYISRSGSTFFASQVARRFSQVLVLPELRLPGLLVRHDLAASADPRQALIDLVKADHQFATLEMSMNDVEACIDRMQGDYRAQTFLEQIAEFVAARKGFNPQAVLYKCGAAGRYWPEIRQRLGKVELIHVFRDPRAAVNSAMRTQRPYHPGQRMGRGDPWLQAQRWNTYIDRMNQLDAQGRLLLQVKYEALCTDPDRVMSDFAKALGLTAMNDSGAELSLAAREASIHANVDQAAMPERSNAWQTEMPRWQGLVVERVTRDMRLPVYADYFTDACNPLIRLANIAYGYCLHRWSLLVFRRRRRRARKAVQTQK